MKNLLTFPSLQFDERSHIYRLDRIEIPSVSSVMKALSDETYGGVDEYLIKQAAARGSAVHSAIENYMLYGIEDIPTEHQGYFDAFRKWSGEHAIVPQSTEMRVYHKALLYAGTVDLVARVDGKLTLVDYKTSAALQRPLYGVQLAAYDKALQSHGLTVEQRAILHLKRTGEYEFATFPANAEYWRVFTALLTVHNYKKKLK